MNDAQRVILGIDPGTMILGYGVILADRRKVHYVDMGVVDLRKEKDHFAKLNTIFTEVSGIISRYTPDDVAVEAPFYGKNPQVMLKLGRAQGAAIAAAIAANVPIFEYAPRKVKMAVTGQGAASFWTHRMHWPLPCVISISWSILWPIQRHPLRGRNFSALIPTGSDMETGN